MILFKPGFSFATVSHKCAYGAAVLLSLPASGRRGSPGTIPLVIRGHFPLPLVHYDSDLSRYFRGGDHRVHVGLGFLADGIIPWTIAGAAIAMILPPKEPV